jgi:hypothetical protein
MVKHISADRVRKRLSAGIYGGDLHGLLNRATGSAEAELLSTATPGARTVMRRSDRAVAVMARRTPRILRRMARLGAVTRRS